MLEFPVAAGAFCLFVLYDVNSVALHKRWLQTLFPAGCLILLYTMGRCLLGSAKAFAPGSLRLCLGGAGALACLGLLLYTLFFAIPFESTYVKPREDGRRPPVCKTGAYGLCRHPGVLCLAGVCFFLAFMAPTARMVGLAVWICLLNVAYVCFQDIWTFPRTFYDYDDYRRQVPFLIPRKRKG